MYLEIEDWRINRILQSESSIDPKPQYQRGGVWSEKKKRLLIDSILRGMDIPKFYLRETPPESGFTHEVADGQQRLRAIWEFSKGEFSLGECEIEGINLSNLTYLDLKNDDTTRIFADNFRRFKLTVSLIKDATDDEVRTLFARLQMGSALNQPELRNAVASSIGFAINMMVETHAFFLNSSIPKERFKRQDYLANVLTLVHFNNAINLKAEAILKMYEDLALNYPRIYFTKANKILNWLNALNQQCHNRIKNKWAFVDFFWFLFRYYDDIESIDYDRLALAFIKFEDKRLLYNSEPQILIRSEDRAIRDKNLADYILAFNYSGGNTDNIDTRTRVFEQKFLRFIELKEE